jgi:hypothetical protein
VAGGLHADEKFCRFAMLSQTGEKLLEAGSRIEDGLGANQSLALGVEDAADVLVLGDVDAAVSGGVKMR